MFWGPVFTAYHGYRGRQKLHQRLPFLGPKEVPKLVTVLAQHYNNNPVFLSLLATPNCGYK
jgi:hypothetical protein